MDFDTIHKAADFIREQHGATIPNTAMVLGSGLNDLADSLTDATILSYEDIPGFPVSTVAGHAGRMLIGNLGETPVICYQGRAHAYEGYPHQLLAFPTRVLWALGVETLILTNAAGSLRTEAGPGSLVAITDHINFSNINPLVGINDDRIGVRFPDMGNAWDNDLRKTLHKTADDLDIILHDGVYLIAQGPNFETPAEIRAFRTMGADLVGMSTVPECLAARHAGLKVVGISSVTNYAAGMTDGELTHGETMEYGAIAAKYLDRLLREFVTRI